MVQKKRSEKPADERIAELEQELSKLKASVAALRVSEEMFSAFLKYSPIYVFFKDKEIRSIRLSDNYEQMLGMPVEKALGKSMFELFPSEFAESMVADDRKILEKGEVVEVVEELDGRIYETIKFPILVNGVPDMLAGFSSDITEKMEITEKLRDNEERLSVIFNNTFDQQRLISVDPDGELRVLHRF